MVTHGLGLTVFGLVVFAVVVAFGIWAIRHHNRMFPKGFDRTGGALTASASAGS